MDLEKNPEEIESHLQALRKLYSLLVVTDPGQCLQNHTFRDEILDEKARSLLKDLLDNAAEKVLKVTSEVIASNLGLFSTHNFTQQPQSQDLLKPTLLLTNAQYTSDVVKHCDDDLQWTADSTNNHRVPDDETFKSVASEQSEVSSSLAKLRNRKKRCRFCQRSSAKQLKSIEKRKSPSDLTQDINKGITSPFSKPWQQVDEQEVQAFNYNVTKDDSSYDREMEERISDFRFNPTGNISPTCLFNSDATGIVKAGALQNFATGSGRKNEDMDFISKDASDAIKTIESRISALKVGSKQVVGPLRKQIADHQGPFKFAASFVTGTGSIGPVRQKRGSLPSQVDRPQFGFFVVGRNDQHSLLVNRKNWEPKDSIPLNRVSRHKVNPPREFNLPNQSLPTVGSTDTMKLDKGLLTVNAGSKQIQAQTKMSTTVKGLSHPTNMRQTVRGKRSDRFRVSPIYPDQMKEEMSGVKEKLNHEGHERRSLTDQHESVGTTSGPTTSSSSWTTQQDNTSYYDSEEHSVSDQSQSRQYSGTNTSSESKEGRYVSDNTPGHHSGGTSYSVDEMYSLPSCTPSQADSNSSSENREYLSSDQSSSLGYSDSSQVRHSWRYRSRDRKRSTKQIGRLKKLKDKLAIIFHHHHHHHHHHHYNDDAGHSEQQFHLKNGTSLLKHTAKMFNRRSRDEAYAEQSAEKLRKSMVHSVPNKKQGANLHKLVNGFVRHVRHSSKSKMSKGGIDHKPKEHQYASKKLVKKVRWWQLLRRRRKMKMPKRPKVKLGRGNKKSKLQAVPTLKWR